MSAVPGQASALLAALGSLLAGIAPRIVACSGGIDSLLLATIAHRADPRRTVITHARSPAVPAEAGQRLAHWAAREGWNVQYLASGEFADEQYLANPVNRCYFCKSHLYTVLDALAAAADRFERGATVLSGANVDDLGEYRPGLDAAREHAVRHPFIEAGIRKQDIRAIARSLDLPFSEIPASPCLASRLYTGTRVTAARLRAVDHGEMLVRGETGIGVVRCRIDGVRMLIEVGAADRERISAALLARLAAEVRAIEPGIETVEFDPQPYRPGRAFVASA
ncbi:MAG: ATPase [Gammaproteobacteria bacterium]